MFQQSEKMEVFLLVKLKILDYLEGGVDGTNFTVSGLHTSDDLTASRF